MEAVELDARERIEFGVGGTAQLQPLPRARPGSGGQRLPTLYLRVLDTGPDTTLWIWARAICWPAAPTSGAADPAPCELQVCSSDTQRRGSGRRLAAGWLLRRAVLRIQASYSDTDPVPCRRGGFN